MRRYLVVANRTLGGRHLIEQIRRAVATGPCAFHVVAPVPPDAGTDDQAAAQRRLNAQLERIAALGAEHSGEVVAGDPYDVAIAAIAEHTIDELVVCTLPPGLSRWLGGDLVGRLREATNAPITHIIAPAGRPDRVTAQAVRLSIYIGESDRHGHAPLHTEIVRRARDAGLAGATVVRGVEGFGASSVIHTSRLLTMSEDLPMVVIVIDTPDRIDGFLPLLDELITEGLVVRENVDVIKYAGRDAD
jgi:PII-like signaling protein